MNLRHFKKRAVVLVAFVASFAFGLAPFQAYAQRRFIVKNIPELLGTVLCPIAGVIFAVLMIVSIIMVLMAAYDYIRSQGEEELIKRARRTLIYASVGVLVAVVANSLPSIVSTFFGTNSIHGCINFSGGSYFPW